MVIISFDLSEERFQQVLSVPEVNGDIRFRELGIHGANLLMYHGTYDCFRAWTMSEYEKRESWTKLFSVSTKGIRGYYSDWEKILVAHPRSGEIVFLLSMYLMILFNPQDNNYKYYPIQKSGDIDCHLCRNSCFSLSWL
ncbi:uncharacterized protein J3R85_003072 [Psidium guajava]|nr:uncharacterized protein J3R85_003072 [Psidium guajava]